MVKLKLMLEWGNNAFLWQQNNDGVYLPVRPHNLKISKQLINDLEKWDRIFQSTLDKIYPPESGFTSREANNLLTVAINTEGKHLLSRIKSELNNNYDITYDELV